MSTKRKLFLFLFVLCIFVIPLVTSIMKEPEPVEAESDVITEEEYATITSKYQNVDGEKILNPEFTGLVFVGRSSCEKCRLFLPVVQSIVRGNEDKIYYFDTDANRNKPSFDEVLNEYGITAVPDVIWIESNHVERFGIVEINEGGKFYEWVEEKLESH